MMTAAFVAVVVFAPSTLTDEPADWEIVDVCLGSEHSSNPIVAHYHATLRIFLDGSEVSIASDIGINDSECDGMRGIHTHDETGRLHIVKIRIVKTRLHIEFTEVLSSTTEFTIVKTRTGCLIHATIPLTISVQWRKTQACGSIYLIHHSIV